VRIAISSTMLRARGQSGVGSLRIVRDVRHIARERLKVSK